MNKKKGKQIIAEKNKTATVLFFCMAEKVYNCKVY